MEVFEAVPKPWGNSLGVTIPKDIIKKEQINKHTKVKFLVICSEKKKIKNLFGTLRLKKPTQQAMDEIDEGYD